MVMGKIKENREFTVDWSKFKSNASGKVLQDSKKGYIEFCKMLNEVDFELVSDYIGALKEVKLIYKSDSGIGLNKHPNSFKTQIYKTITKFKEDLKKNNDEFLKFVDLSGKNSLIAKIRTFDGGIIDIDMSQYSSFNSSRKDFYDKLKEVNGCIADFYKGNDKCMTIYISDVKLNPMSTNTFKTYTYKAILDFKEKLIKNNDGFIKFVGLSGKSSLIAKIKTFDGGEISIDTRVYGKFNKARQDFYKKLREVGGYTTDYYIDKRTKIDIYIEDVKLNPMTPDAFKRQTYKVISDFKNNLIKNGDKFIRFIGLTDNENLIAKIRTFDGGIVERNNALYNKWIKGRQSTYDYCEEKGYKILSPYIGSKDKILIDFNCGHKPNWIAANNLKQNQGCPICNESKGERAIRLYLENNKINFEREYRFEDCRYKRSLSFDFYIPEKNLCIEFDGRQHFEANDYFGEKSFKDTQKRDKIKNKFCKDNGINLLRIPYYELDNIEDILDEEFDRLRKLNDGLKETC